MACRIRLFCKGADNVIYGRLAPGQPLDQSTQPHLAEMARSGFRTLCIAQRDIQPEAYEVGGTTLCNHAAQRHEEHDYAAYIAPYWQGCQGQNN